jgi:hypothetical protein
MEAFEFEIVKNCAGTLVIPNVPSSKKIDSKLLMKSISPTGYIFIRLLYDLSHVSEQIDYMLSKSIFDTEKGEGIDSDSNDVSIVRDSRHSSGTCTSSTSTTTSTCTTTESDVGDGAGKGQSSY